MNSLGARLKRARERKVLKQTQVKEKTGINNKTLSGYENEVSEPDIETLKILAELYEVSLDWLLGNENNKGNAPTLPESEYVRVIEELEKEYGVSLRDDPIVLSSVRQMIEIIAQTKRDRL